MRSEELMIGDLVQVNGEAFKIISISYGYDGYYCFVTYGELIKVPYKKELIDACVEMVVKLHEEKLL